MTGLIICAVIAGLALGLLACCVLWVRAFQAGYSKAQDDLTVELYTLVEELKQPLDHIDAQRVAARDGLQ